MIGVDMGTSSTRVVVLDENGLSRGAASRPTPGLNPSRQVFEQDPEQMYLSVLLTLKDVLSRHDINVSEIGGVAICGQMAGISPIGKGWEAVAPYDSWLDMRCASQVPRLKAYEQQIIEQAGGPAGANHAAKWLYWHEQQPQIYRSISKIIMPAAYVAGRMAQLHSDDAFMDYTYLGFNSFADSRAVRWNTSLIDQFKLDADRLPKLVSPSDRIGSVSASAANFCGLLAGTPIFAGCGDIAATMLGTGIFNPGKLFDISGTGSVLATLQDHYAVDSQHKTVTTFRHCLPELFYSVAYVGGAGISFNKFALEESECRRLEIQARAPLSERNKLLFLPHMGGRHAPFDASLAGAFVGLDWTHDRTDQYRAMMEAIAYEYAYFLQCMRDMKVEIDEGGVLSLGGGANSPLFNQIKADVLGMPFSRLPAAEYGVLGAALLVGQGADIFPDLKQTAIDWQRPVEAVTFPDASKHRFYAGMRNAYERMLTRLKPVFDELHSVPLA
jgi:xylulokinase